MVSVSLWGVCVHAGQQESGAEKWKESGLVSSTAPFLPEDAHLRPLKSEPPEPVEEFCLFISGPVLSPAGGFQTKAAGITKKR